MFTFFNKEELAIINGKSEAEELISLAIEAYKVTY